MKLAAAQWVSAVITLILVLLTSGVFLPAFARARIARLNKKTTKTQRTLEKIERYKRSSNGRALSAVLGADGRLSTSKAIAAIWTALIAYVLILLILVQSQNWDVLLKNLWPNYLLFLGGPYAALVFAKVAVTAKIGAGTLQKTSGDGYARLSDLVTGDEGRRDLVDIQFVIFNLIAMGFVLSQVLRPDLTENGLPLIPTGLVTLTAGPAAVYAANKALVSNSAVILSVTPSLVRAGEVFTIYGANFLPGVEPGRQVPAALASTPATAPAGGTPPPAPVALVNPGTAGSSAAQPPYVEVGGVQVESIAPTNTSIQAVAKASAVNSSRPVAVAVVTASGQRVVLPDALTVLVPAELVALDRLSAMAGDLVTLTGGWTSAPSLSIVVVVGGVAAVIENQPVPGVSITFRVPAVAAGGAKVKLVVGGLSSNELDLAIR